MTERKETLFFTGYARLPGGITASELSKVVGIGLEVEPESGRIVAADCTLSTSVGRSFFASIVEGKSLWKDLDAICAEISSRYFGNAQKALIAALKIAHEKYETYRLARD